MCILGLMYLRDYIIFSNYTSFDSYTVRGTRALTFSPHLYF